LLLAWSSVFMLATLYPQLAGKVARAGAGMGFSAALAPSAIGTYLSAPALPGQWISAGTFTTIQFAGPAICGLFLVSLFFPQAQRFLNPFAWLAAVGIAASVLVTIIPKDFATTTSSDWVSTILTDVHPISGCIWVGGLFALAILAATRTRLGTGAGIIWAFVWKRFSLVAEICVGVTLASGLFLSWQLVGSIPEMWQTNFGRMLSLKILLVSGLIAMGAYNEFALLPRVTRLREEGNDVALFKLVLHHFPKTVAIEVVLGVAVLVVVPFLNDSARQQGGTSVDPGDTGGIFAAVGILIVLGIIAFIASARLHASLDRPRAEA
jgi:copper transport protein